VKRDLKVGSRGWKLVDSFSFIVFLSEFFPFLFIPFCFFGLVCFIVSSPFLVCFFIAICFTLFSHLFYLGSCDFISNLTPATCLALKGLNIVVILLVGLKGSWYSTTQCNIISIA
jgi:hypothetical protein